MNSSIKKSQNIVGMVGIILGIFSIFISIFFTPAFVTKYLSPDHFMTPEGIIELFRYRVILFLIGLFIIFFGAILILVKNSLENIYGMLYRRRKVFYYLVLTAFCIVVIYTYAMDIIPRLIKIFFGQDIQQDYIGARALINRSNELYPVLAPAFAKMGLIWNANGISTHPPTAFLLTLPLVLFNYKIAQFAWMAAMLTCLLLTAHVLGLTWKKSIFVSILSLAWPPTFWSLFQFTPIWLLGLAFAYRYRQKAFTSGIYIALASLPKFLAAPSLLYHLRRRKWQALLGFCVLWMIAISFLLLLRPDSLTAYVHSNIGNSATQVTRKDNGALIVEAWRHGGWIGVSIIAIFILWIIWIAFHREGLLEWSLFVWLGIALLPIAWNYSLLPLLPWLLLLLLRTKRIISRIIALAVLFLSIIPALPGDHPTVLALSILLSGVAFLSASEREMQVSIEYLSPQMSQV